VVAGEVPWPLDIAFGLHPVAGHDDARAHIVRMVDGMDDAGVDLPMPFVVDWPTEDRDILGRIVRVQFALATSPIEELMIQSILYPERVRDYLHFCQLLILRGANPFDGGAIARDRRLTAEQRAIGFARIPEIMREFLTRAQQDWWEGVSGEYSEGFIAEIRREVAEA
jgi:hypothetical protein